jgi:hypothetical protein
MLTASDITGILETHYKREANSEERSFPIRGSAMGSCPRRLSSLLAKRRTVPLTYKAGRVFEDGHDRGVSIGRAFAESYRGPGKVLLEHAVWTTIPGIQYPEVLVTLAQSWSSDEDFEGPSLRVHLGQLQVRSRCDIVIAYPDRHCDVIEVKGKNGFGFKKLEEEGIGVEYETQGAFQVRGLEEEGLVVDSIHWLFESKDTQEWKPIGGAGFVHASVKSALAHAASILNAYSKPGFTGDEGTPIHIPAGGGKLPWQCNYCSVGPLVGNCCLSKTLIDRRKPGALMPAWEAV